MNSASPPEAPLTRREEAKAMFRSAILDAAERVFAEHGFHVARIQDVAKLARIAVGTVYNHFEQKEDLLRALMEERTAEIVAQLEPLPSDPAGFEERLVTRLTRVLAYIEQHRGFFLIAMEHGLLGKGPGAADEVCGKRLQQVEKFRETFRNLIEEGLAAGALEPMPVHRLAWALGGMLRLFTHGALMEGLEPDLQALAPVIAGLFLRGAARKSAPAVRSREAAPKAPARTHRSPKKKTAPRVTRTTR